MNGKRYRNTPRHGERQNIDVVGEKMSIFCRTHIAVGHRIQGGSPDPSDSNTPLAIGEIELEN